MAVDESPWEVLDAYVPALSENLDRLITRLSNDTGLLGRGVAAEVLGHQANRWLCRNRLFGVAVLGSQGDDPMAAVPVAVTSLLWWSGAEALDDLSDAYTSGQAGAALMAMPASVTNLLVLPVEYIDAQDVTAALKAAWRRELLRSCRLAAEGQLAEAYSPDIVGRDHVLAGYRGKTGAAYARDAVMAASVRGRGLARGRAVEAWREFGMLYGTLRQLHNDNSGAAAPEDEDLANYTPTLRVAHAFSTSGAAQRRRLVRLRQAARTDLAARQQLHDFLNSDAVTASYREDVRGLHRQAAALLDSLCGAGPYRDVLHAGLDIAATYALKSHPAPAGTADMVMPQLPAR